MRATLVVFVVLVLVALVCLALLPTVLLVANYGWAALLYFVGATLACYAMLAAGCVALKRLEASSSAASYRVKSWKDVTDVA